MRTFRVEINGSLYNVSVDQIGKDRFRAQVEETFFEMENVSTDGISTWLVREADETVRAQTIVLPSDRVDVWLAGMPFPAAVQTVGTGGYSISAEVHRQRSIGGQVRALMPGRITSVLVKVDELVKEGTPLLILEAMKMQNEIGSPIAGKVKSISVHEGATVKKDSVLITIE
ncbi:MAG TPA: biotin/lipoyl-containing protein [Candidatus Acidoferrales bacterium]|nr:biotin/lipoyl-containing protein [Candidatus Acidoferrales bacterium]